MENALLLNWCPGCHPSLYSGPYCVATVSPSFCWSYNEASKLRCVENQECCICRAILNLFGVLKLKREAEQFLESSGLPYTILRPSRLTDGPYTSYDLNTLLKATAGSKRDVQLSTKDELLGQASRIMVAEAAVQSLMLPGTDNATFAISSTEGEGPGTDTDKWNRLFESCATLQVS